MRISNMIVTEICEVLTVYSVKGDHLHRVDRESYGLSLCRSGRIVYRHGGRDFVSDAASAILLPKGATYDLNRQVTGMFPLVNFQATGLTLDEFTLLPLQNPVPALFAYDALFRAFVQEKNHLRAMRCLYELFDLIFSAPGDGEDILAPAECYLREHLADPDLRNADLARAANVSEVYFRKLFTRRHGVSPRRYILAARLENAKRRLAGSRESVGEIAAACGFSDIFHFCRAFRDAVGCTPGEYRKRVSVI